MQTCKFIEFTVNVVKCNEIFIWDQYEFAILMECSLSLVFGSNLSLAKNFGLSN